MIAYHVADDIVSHPYDVGNRRQVAIGCFDRSATYDQREQVMAIEARRPKSDVKIMVIFDETHFAVWA